MIDRRTVVRGLTALPLLGVAAGLGAVLLPYLKPTAKPMGLPSKDLPLNKDKIAANLDEFPKDYDFKEFVFTQETVEYTARGKQATDILGYIVRIPNGKIDAKIGETAGNPIHKGYAQAQYKGQTYSMVVVSRICAHLGCIFQYKQPADVCSGFNYCAAKNPHFACPCHLSVYDPTQVDPATTNLPGKVVSGPAPRTPFPFDFEINANGEIIIKAYA